MPQVQLPLATLACLLALPLLVAVLRRRKLAWSLCLMGTGLVLLLAAAVWPLGQVRVASPLTGPPVVSASQANAICAALLENIYSAMAGRGEDQVYDALAASVDGPLLRQMYLHVRSGLEFQEDGGAVAVVQGVKLLGAEREDTARAEVGALSSPKDRDPRGFTLNCQWAVRGKVEHWGHVHQRTNLYAARLTIEPRSGTWKITDLDLLDEELGEIETVPEIEGPNAEEPQIEEPEIEGAGVPS
jgi:hypothetical protein